MPTRRGSDRRSSLWGCAGPPLLVLALATAMSVQGGSSLLGRYRVLRRLGSGGMASVYLAEDERLRRRVAVKRLHAESSEETARRLEREARVGASLNHPNIVAVYDTATDAAGVLVVMEYVDGEALSARLRRGPLPQERALEVVESVAAALDYAHGAGVVHRDVKPGNVLLGRDGQLKLVDLGIAQAAEHTRLTTTGTVLGTASYMAPEQLEGRRVGPEADVYALAAVAFEALSGRRALPASTPVELAHRIASGPPPDLRDVMPDASVELAAALARGMARDPAARPPSAGELARELRQAIGRAAPERPAAGPLGAGRRGHAGTPSPAPPRRPDSGGPPDARVRRRRTLAARAGVAAVVIAVGAVAVAVLGAGDGGSGAGRGAADERSPGSGGDAEGGDAAPRLFAEGGGDPARGAALNARGKALIDQGRFAAAVPVLERAVQSFPEGTSDIQYAYALFNLGNALRLSGRPGEAIPVLERRLEIPDQRDVVRAELRLARAEAGG